MALLIPEVFILLLTDAVFLLMMIYVSPTVFRVITNWDISNQTQIQYKLEKNRLLVSTIVKFAFIFKIPLFLFYIYLNDKLSNVLTGAMCATGSINATVYGIPLLYTKIALIYLMYIWLVLYNCNNSFHDLPYTKAKYKLLLFIIIVITAESLLTYLNFANIDPTEIVSCCSSIYSTTSENGSLLMSLKPFTAFFYFFYHCLSFIAGVFAVEEVISHKPVFSPLFLCRDSQPDTFHQHIYLPATQPPLSVLYTAKKRVSLYWISFVYITFHQHSIRTECSIL